MTQKLSQNAIGRALGLTSAAMVKLKKQGCPMDSVEAAQAWREARQNVAMRKPVPKVKLVAVPSAPPPIAEIPKPPTQEYDYPGIPAEDHQTARTRREIAEANLAEIREAEERREVIRVDSVKSALAAVFSTSRDALLQIPARLAPILAAETSTGAIQSILHAEIHQALTMLAGAASNFDKPA